MTTSRAVEFGRHSHSIRDQAASVAPIEMRFAMTWNRNAGQSRRPHGTNGPPCTDIALLL
jgi:hypothetical protein